MALCTQARTRGDALARHALRSAPLTSGALPRLPYTQALMIGRPTVWRQRSIAWSNEKADAGPTLTSNAPTQIVSCDPIWEATPTATLAMAPFRSCRA